MKTVETDVLVVGAGPAGLAATALLARSKTRAITIAKHKGTADSPRAHITNQRTVEIFRDLGMEKRVMAFAMPADQMGVQVYATSFSGIELARKMTWGAGARQRSEYDAGSPCGMCNAPQHLLEPAILETAAAYGAEVRFNTELLTIAQDAGGVTAIVRNRATGDEYKIRSRYAIGCDGGRSTVAEQGGFEFEGKADLGRAFTVWLEADLSKHTAHRSGALFMVCRPGNATWLSAWTCVRPWTEWNPLFLQTADSDMSEAAIMKLVSDCIEDPSIDVRIKKVSQWQINHLYAKEYRRGRIFIAGDAAHRHPPSNGLGSNTCIQDSYNLAWKLDLVLRDLADDSLLDSYNAERQPVGKQVVERANKSLVQMGPFAQALGVRPGNSVDQAIAELQVLTERSVEGARRRGQLHEALELQEWQFNAHGVEMGQRYTSSAVVEDGTPFPPYTRDPELHYHPTTHPGAYLPHAWLDSAGRSVSTLDIVGKGRFCVLTGVGGGAWLEAAGAVSRQSGIRIDAYQIGYRQGLADVYGDWARLREIAEDGCLLVRPDGHVAWRSHALVDNAEAALARAMRSVAGRN